MTTLFNNPVNLQFNWKHFAVFWTPVYSGNGNFCLNASVAVQNVNHDYNAYELVPNSKSLHSELTVYRYKVDM